MDILLYVLFGVVLTCTAFLAGRKILGFSAQRPDDYSALEPQFDIRQYLNGPIECEGVIYGPTGRVASRFVADMHAQWDGNVGTMTEEFRYDSGATQSREWQLTLGEDGNIRAEAPDLVGTGQGEQKGAGVRLNYRIRLPEASGGHVLNTTDWMYLIENGNVINRSQFRKYGIKVAELVATMRPKQAAVAAE